MQKFNSKTDPKKLYLPNQMPMFAGSPGYLSITRGQKITYIIAWLVFGLSAGLMNASTVVFLAEFSAQFALNANESTLLMCVYFMTASWASLFLFKLRQHFGVHFFLRALGLGLAALLLLRGLSHSFAAELLARALSGTICICLSIASIFYAGSFLPAAKRMLMLLLGLGLMQLGTPLARICSLFLAHAGGIVPNLIALENALCVLCLALLYLAPLPPSFKTPSFNGLNILSMGLFATSAALLCFCFSFAGLIWYDEALIWGTFAAGMGLLALLIIIEFRRRHPLLNIRFLSKFELLKTVATAALMRIFLAEQNVSTTGFFKGALGYGDEALGGLYAVIFAGALAGFVACYFTLRGFERFKLLVWLSFALLAVGSYLNTGLSAASAPQQVYFGQFLIAFAGVFFLAPLMIDGMLKSFVRGSAYLVSFAAVFGFAQSVFGLLGSAAINYFLQEKTRAFTQALLSSLSAPPTAAQSAQISKIAAASAYSEMFYVVFLIALIMAIFLFAEWLILRIKGVNIHARELALLGAMMKKRQEQTQEILAARSRE